MTSLYWRSLTENEGNSTHLVGFWRRPRTLRLTAGLAPVCASSYDCHPPPPHPISAPNHHFCHLTFCDSLHLSVPFARLLHPLPFALDSQRAKFLQRTPGPVPPPPTPPRPRAEPQGRFGLECAPAPPRSLHVQLPSRVHPALHPPYRGLEHSSPFLCLANSQQPSPAMASPPAAFST